MNAKSTSHNDECPYCGTRVGWLRYQVGTVTCPQCGAKSELSIKRRVLIGLLCGLVVVFLGIPVFRFYWGEPNGLFIGAGVMFILVTIAMGIWGGRLQQVKKK